MPTVQLPEDLERYIQAEVQGGRFASPDEVIVAALSLLRRKAESSRREDPIADEVDGQMLEAGLLSRIPPRLDPATYEEFTPIVIQGEPLSETIIRERVEGGPGVVPGSAAISACRSPAGLSTP